MSNRMVEFLLWSNCTNKCDFCWQCKKANPDTLLNKNEMIQCIKDVSKKLDTINKGDDVLLVGGEILNEYYDEVTYHLLKLFKKCVLLLKNNTIRYVYINTNLLYSNNTLLDYTLLLFELYHDRLKFTTSYDVYGRFKNKLEEDTFFKNLEFIRNIYPSVNIVMNCIITKQLVEKITKEPDFFSNIQKEYNLQYINFIPYVPIDDDHSMDVTFKDIIKVLAINERKNPGYIDFYINDLDFNQNKILYEYTKSKGFVECTSEYLPCHHNENFKKILGNDECFVCKLKEIFR